MKHTLSILVENRFGELARIVGLFSARGYNIDSLTVATTVEPQISRVILITDGSDKTIDQIVRQLDKQVRVISVVDLTAMDLIEREMALLHVKTKSTSDRSEIMELVDIFGARVIDASPETVTIEAMAERDRLDALLILLQPFGISDIVRGGTLAIGRILTTTANNQRA
jgi:acetolactate synthase I/III small subunit